MVVNFATIRKAVFIIFSCILLLSVGAKLVMGGLSDIRAMYHDQMAFQAELKQDEISEEKHEKEAASWKGKATNHYKKINSMTIFLVFMVYLALCVFILIDSFFIKSNDSIKIYVENKKR